MTLLFHEYDNVDNVMWCMCRTWTGLLLWEVGFKGQRCDKVLGCVLVLYMKLIIYLTLHAELSKVYWSVFQIS